MFWLNKVECSAKLRNYRIFFNWNWKAAKMDDRTVDLIFAGSLESLPPVSSKIVRIFTSSTFTGTFDSWFLQHFPFEIRIGSMSLYTLMNKKTKFFAIDTTMERNTLMAKCYPRIKDYCREKHGLEFQVGFIRTQIFIFQILIHLNQSVDKRIWNLAHWVSSLQIRMILWFLTSAYTTNEL